MTTQEFDRQLKILSDKYKADKKQICTRFATENNPYKKGDIIETIYNECLEITDIEPVWYGIGVPQMVYTGFLLLDNKRLTIVSISQRDIKEINKLTKTI